MKKTVIIGATTNPSQYAYLAASMLTKYTHPIVPVGIITGKIQGIQILDLRQKPRIEEVDTITLYIGPRHQPEWYDYLLSLKPKRIIFNPGTENVTFEEMAEKEGIEVLEACTLVMLKTNQY